MLIDSQWICLWSWCKEFVVNFYYKIPHDPYANICLCSVFSIVGCNINFTMHEVNIQTVQANYLLYQHTVPIHLSANILVLRQIVQHPDLRRHLKQLQKDSKEVMVTVHHSSQQIQRILRRIQRETASSHWWVNFFGSPTNFSGAWAILLYPVIVLLIIQVWIAVHVILLTFWVRRRVRAVNYNR